LWVLGATGAARPRAGRPIEGRPSARRYPGGSLNETVPPRRSESSAGSAHRHVPVDSAGPGPGDPKPRTRTPSRLRSRPAQRRKLSVVKRFTGTVARSLGAGGKGCVFAERAIFFFFILRRHPRHTSSGGEGGARHDVQIPALPGAATRRRVHVLTPHPQTDVAGCFLRCRAPTTLTSAAASPDRGRETRSDPRISREQGPLTVGRPAAAFGGRHRGSHHAGRVRSGRFFSGATSITARPHGAKRFGGNGDSRRPAVDA